MSSYGYQLENSKANPYRFPDIPKKKPTMSQTQSITPIPSTPPPSRRANRPPRINIHNLTSGSAMSQASMPPSAQPPYTAQTNFTGNGTQGPYWPPMANPFGYGNFMTKGYEGFLDITKSGLSFGEKMTFGMYKWSRRWFTHIFLILILALYNIGGAVVFRTIEGEIHDPEHPASIDQLAYQLPEDKVLPLALLY